jgi:hypothetical protein
MVQVVGVLGLVIQTRVSGLGFGVEAIGCRV